MRGATRRLAVCALLVLAAAQPVGAVTILRGGVLGNGGTPSAGSTAAGKALFGTAGQAVVGVSGNTNNILCSGFWCFGGSRVLAVDPGGGTTLPTELAIGSAAPNPSRGVTRFSLALPEAAEVTFTVYDVAGRRVGEPVRRSFNAGRYELFWRAPAEDAGVYFARVQVSGRLAAERRIVLVR